MNNQLAPQLFLSLLHLSHAKEKFESVSVRGVWTTIDHFCMGRGSIVINIILAYGVQVCLLLAHLLCLFKPGL